jgi:hypothetical protein
VEAGVAVAAAWFDFGTVDAVAAAAVVAVMCQLRRGIPVSLIAAVGAAVDVTPALDAAVVVGGLHCIGAAVSVIVVAGVGVIPALQSAAIVAAVAAEVAVTIVSLSCCCTVAGLDGSSTMAAAVTAAAATLHAVAMLTALRQRAVAYKWGGDTLLQVTTKQLHTLRDAFKCGAPTRARTPGRPRTRERVREAHCACAWVSARRSESVATRIVGLCASGFERGSAVVGSEH